MLFSYHLLYFCTALSLIIMLSSHYHHHKSKTFSQLTQCPFTGTLLLLLCPPCVWRHTLFLLILRKNITAIFTKFGMQGYWVSVLLGIAFSCSSFAYRVIPKYSYFQYLLVSVDLREHDSRYFTKIRNTRLLCL